MSDMKVQQKQSLSRREAARFLAALAEGLADDGNVTVQLGSSTLELSVADQVDWELEVEIDGDEIELELELKWSTSGRVTAEAAEEESAEDDSEEASSEDVASEEDASEPVPGAGDAEQPESGRDVAEGDAGTGESDGDTGSDGAESVEAATERTPASPRGRSSNFSRAGKPAFNGVDTAAVRAWAAANGLTVSPRGRIKDEVLQAYRDAGN